MIGRLWQLARGEVRVRVTGASLPRFLNLCAAHGLTLRRMERTAWNELYAGLSIRDFRALRRHMGRTGCRVHIVRRRGAPFAAERLRPRVLLWGGFALLGLVWWVLCTRVWAIEAQISPALPAQEVMRQLSELGVRIGAPLDALDTHRIRWRMLQLQPDMHFFALNIRGNSVFIQVGGAESPAERFDEDAATKVVAARDGVVASVHALDGQAVVQPGDAVQTGDTLISGLVPPTQEGGSYRLTHAHGAVQAHTRHTVQTARALDASRKQYTGRVRRQYALTLGNKRLNLYIGSGITGATCDKIVETRTWRLSDSVVFPVSLVVQTYVYYEPVPAEQTVETVRADMLSRALGDIAAAMDGTVTAHSETLTGEGGAAVLRLSAHAVEQIGVEARDDSELPPPEEEEQAAPQTAPP